MADLSLNPLFAHSTISSSFMADPQWLCIQTQFSVDSSVEFVIWPCAQRATETWRHTCLNCILTRSPPNIYLVSEELSCVAGLILVLWGTSILVPKVTDCHLLKMNLSFSLCLGHLYCKPYGAAMWAPFWIPNSIPVVLVPLYSTAKYLVKLEISETNIPVLFIPSAHDCLGYLFKVFLLYVHMNIRVKNSTTLAMFVIWYIN